VCKKFAGDNEAFYDTNEMKISYSKPDEIDVSGPAQELALTSQKISNLLRSRSRVLEIEAEINFDPSPYSEILRRMTIIRAEGPTRITVVDDESLKVDGSDENLKRFASFFDFDLDAGVGDHSHYEYYEGNEYIASDSVPIVISVRWSPELKYPI
jgi:hypothetical protein